MLSGHIYTYLYLSVLKWTQVDIGGHKWIWDFGGWYICTVDQQSIYLQTIKNNLTMALQFTVVRRKDMRKNAAADSKLFYGLYITIEKYTIFQLKSIPVLIVCEDKKSYLNAG